MVKKSAFLRLAENNISAALVRAVFSTDKQEHVTGGCKVRKKWGTYDLKQI
jgi:hypothetical protein